MLLRKLSAGFVLPVLAIVCGFAEASTAEVARDGVIKEYKSLYRDVSVVQYNNRRCLRLKNKRNPYNSQSCLLLDSPNTMLFFYTQAMMISLASQEDGVRVLNVGLGGGTLPNAIRSYFPNAKVTTVELDPQMLQAAKDYMFFEESKNNAVVIQDARYFIRKQQKRKEKYDVVLLDAFDGEYIPEHLTTQEFLQEVKSILEPGGMVLANTFSHKDFFDSESVTYESVFPGFCSYRSGSARTLVGFNGKACNKEQVVAAITKDIEKLKQYVPAPDRLAHLLTDETYWDTEARIFTDQFSPANLLNN